MKKLIFILVLIWCSDAFAAGAPDRRLCDQDGDCASITAAGELMVSGTNEGFRTSGPYRPTQFDRRISDNSGHVASISADGTLQTS